MDDNNDDVDGDVGSTGTIYKEKRGKGKGTRRLEQPNRTITHQNTKHSFMVIVYECVVVSNGNKK